MIRILMLTAAGMLVGALIAYPLGATLGAVLGLAVGLAWHAVGARVPSLAAWLHTRQESHRVMCIPKGTAASCEFVRDEVTGKIVDVTRCSLSANPDEVNCPKQCVTLMRDAHA